MPDVVMLDPVVMEQTFSRQVRRTKSETVVYYRKPATWPPSKGYPRGRPNPEAGWICWGDTQPGKRLAKMSMGFEPLPQYGRIIGGSDERPSALDLYGIWGPILTARGGPEAFPVGQILTYRWYNPLEVPIPLEGTDDLGNNFDKYQGEPGRLFPQLAEYVRNGGEIVEYECPECSTFVFAQPLHLARHLRVSHDYDRTNILALGQELGVDLTKAFGKTKGITRVVSVGGARVDEDEADAPESEPVATAVKKVDTSAAVRAAARRVAAQKGAA